MQKYKKVLRGFICSLLNLKNDDIHSLAITNPIVHGEVISAKDFILDLEMAPNNDTLINSELQVVDEKNWTERLYPACAVVLTTSLLAMTMPM